MYVCDILVYVASLSLQCTAFRLSIPIVGLSYTVRNIGLYFKLPSCRTTLLKMLYHKKDSLYQCQMLINADQYQSRLLILPQCKSKESCTRYCSLILMFATAELACPHNTTEHMRTQAMLACIYKSVIKFSGLL